MATLLFCDAFACDQVIRFYFEEDFSFAWGLGQIDFNKSNIVICYPNAHVTIHHDLVQHSCTCTVWHWYTSWDILLYISSICFFALISGGQALTVLMMLTRSLLLAHPRCLRCIKLYLASSGSGSVSTEPVSGRLQSTGVMLTGLLEQVPGVRWVSS